MHRCQDAKRHGLLRFELFKKIDKFLSLNLRNILISPLEGEKKFLSELCELRNFREGYNLKRSSRNSNFNRRLYFLKNINYNSDMLHHDKNYKGRLGILAQREAGFEPSPEFLSSPQLTKKFNPLTKREGCDSVITDNLINMNHSFFLDTVFSRFTSHFSRKCTAFTLAEVLITLGIIGIVAALIMPAVITNYQKKEIAIKLKKDYSQINQVLQRINADYGDVQVFSYSPSVFVQNYILPYYNGAKLYNTPNVANRHEKAMCYHENDPLSGSGRSQYNDLGNSRGGYISTPFLGGTISIELPDGTCLGFNSSTNISWANVQVFIDVNGSNKKPNTLGKDLFYFSYDPNTNSIKPYGYQYEETYCGRAVPNGVMHRGAGCAMKIMRDNWEIKKDYPWK